jgi:hypothetical protein
MTAGRPTLYRPEYCELVIELGRAGKSKAQMAAQIGVCRQTLDEWAKAEPQFANAIARARESAMAWWEEQGMKGIWAGKAFNAQAWSRSMAARFPDDYRENSKVELSGAVEVSSAIVAARKRSGG